MSDRVLERREAIAARHPVWKWTSLPGYLDWSLRDYADRELVITDVQTLSYSEVSELSRRLAAGLASAAPPVSPCAKMRHY